MGDDRQIPLADHAPQLDTCARALWIWPRLDRRKLARTCGDTARVARIVERRTSLPRESIVKMLEVRP